MASSNYHYKKLGHNAVTGKIIRPIIPIELVKKRFSVHIEALLDTGADFCIFTGEVAQLLGIKIEDGRPHTMYGVGGKETHGYIHKIGVTIAPFDTYNAWAFFSNKLNDQNTAILGQQCFFDHFKVSFEYKKELIVIRD